MEKVVCVANDEVRIVKRCSHGNRVRRFHIDETGDEVKELTEGKQFESEAEFWGWFKNRYKNFEGQKLEPIYEIEYCFKGLEERKGIMIIYNKDSIKFIKSSGEGRFCEMDVWFDKDDKYREERHSEELVLNLMSEGEMAYFKDYQDFVIWVVNYWNN